LITYVFRREYKKERSYVTELEIIILIFWVPTPCGILEMFIKVSKEL